MDGRLMVMMMMVEKVGWGSSSGNREMDEPIMVVYGRVEKWYHSMEGGVYLSLHRHFSTAASTVCFFIMPTHTCFVKETADEIV
ncbi:unnamed protein product [Linum tenue]|uniref:Uncharacterized protein n=1 Tax=Linum tenue TaxID=586396 RepID=A0AAV0KP53_9ROSI|nr:unnamed protein product [Linum tenue]